MKWIVGIDEVGRGPIAGPVSVCVFISEKTFNTSSIFPNQTIRDSKKTKKHIRNSLYTSIKQIRKSKLQKIDWVIVSRSAEYIDSYGIVSAIQACIEAGVKRLHTKGYDFNDAEVYLDGGLKLKKSHIMQETIVKGDEKIGHIAIASILAKVYRDNYMTKLSTAYPYFKWESNAGYGTKDHYAALSKYGLTKYHRTTFIN